VQLGEGSDVGSQLGCLPWREVLAQKCFGERISGGEGVGLLILEPVSSSVPQREWEESQSNGVSGDPIELNHVTLRKKIAKMHVGVLIWMPTELIALHQGDEGWAQLEVVDLDRRVHYRGSDTQRLRHNIVSQNSVVLRCHGRFGLLLSACTALLASSSFDFRIQGKQVVTPLTAPVHTKPKTIPSVSKLKQG